MSSPLDMSYFKSEEMNIRGSPSSDPLVQVAEFLQCVVPLDDLPPRQGGVLVGWDLGGSTSMSACVAVWPETGRLETWCGFGDDPPLAKRDREIVGELYVEAQRRGMLRTYPGKELSVDLFLGDIAHELSGENVIEARADRYKYAMADDALARSGVRWKVVYRGTGASAKADGSYDVKAAQKLIRNGAVKTTDNLMLVEAIRVTELRRDEAGNPALQKRFANARIDLCSALVLALGAMERYLAHPPEPPRPARFWVL